jgi:membrane-bound lytic murein transglycosylase D
MVQLFQSNFSIRVMSLLALVIVVCFLAFRSFAPNEALVSVQPDGALQYQWYVPKMPNQMDFAGEPLPLQQFEVKERMQREFISNYYLHGSMLNILRLCTRYFPIIESRLQLNGIPDDFKYLCVAESALQQPTSPAGAVGFWQFMKATAQQYGLEVNDQIDERYHLIKATDAACAFFKAAYAKFGSWTAAAAAYNCGALGYNNQVTIQGTQDYYNLLLPEETNRYVFRIAAFKYLIKYHHQYGFMLNEQDYLKPLALQSLKIETSIEDWAAFAKERGLTYKLLKLYNPWLRAKNLVVEEGKLYTIDLPIK